MRILSTASTGPCESYEEMERDLKFIISDKQKGGKNDHVRFQVSHAITVSDVTFKTYYHGLVVFTTDGRQDL
jgi:hypothetical protein